MATTCDKVLLVCDKILELHAEMSGWEGTAEIWVNSAHEDFLASGLQARSVGAKKVEVVVSEWYKSVFPHLYFDIEQGNMSFRVVTPPYVPFKDFCLVMDEIRRTVVAADKDLVKPDPVLLAMRNCLETFLEKLKVLRGKIKEDAEPVPKTVTTALEYINRALAIAEEDPSIDLTIKFDLSTKGNDSPLGFKNHEL